jgi:hypothetical protein
MRHLQAPLRLMSALGPEWHREVIEMLRATIYTVERMSEDPEALAAGLTIYGDRS